MSNFRRQDAWRKHPLLTNGVKDAFPGFTRAVKIFAVYVVAEQVYKLATTPLESHHEEHSSGAYEWRRGAPGQAPSLEKAEHEHH